MPRALPAWKIYLLLAGRLLLNAVLPPFLLVSFAILLALAYRRSRWFVPHLVVLLASVALGAALGLGVRASVRAG
ncbi:protein of unknown function [Candidatus Hydrogenisulfobacillus filiaventi]|uniref:Uncharacterized protein n=1 Tax=Candidatus Hydrogenisulfobacillus filiaventi TaxID=2707344 RepID=A0A6F8ZI04_9FIRM|nr:hypothetical protein [Bacillota bacterium]CAB1129394.1 protein of unknown function [Candidatus Hydrogenisulfobacillus filiaventi]